MTARLIIMQSIKCKLKYAIAYVNRLVYELEGPRSILKMSSTLSIAELLIFLSDFHQYVPDVHNYERRNERLRAVYNMICATIADPKKVPVKVSKATTAILNPDFLNKLTSI